MARSTYETLYKGFMNINEDGCRPWGMASALVKEEALPACNETITRNIQWYWKDRVMQQIWMYYKEKVTKNLADLNTFETCIFLVIVSLHAGKTSSFSIKGGCRGCARFPDFVKNFSERQILWSLCSVDFHTLTLQLPIQTPHSVAHELQVFASSLENRPNFSKTSTPLGIMWIHWSPPRPRPFLKADSHLINIHEPLI